MNIVINYTNKKCSEFYFRRTAYPLRVTRRIQRIAISASILTSLWWNAASAQSIRFAQLTDAHILDSANKERDSQAESERGLRWAIQEINRLNEAGPAFDFVAYTGDLGLEKGLAGVADDRVDAALDGMVERVQEYVGASLVRVWLFVPGNNDLIKEDPKTVRHYHSFLRKLQSRLGSRKEIRDLAPKPGESVWVERGDCWFFGLDDASFKSNGKLADRDAFAKSQLECLELLGKNLDAERGRIASLNARLGGQEKPRKFFAYIFSHIPDVDDPYLASLKKTDEELVAQQKPAGDEEMKRFPRSAWMVTKEVRDRWHEILGRDEVRRVFAGHFHSDDRRLYHDVRLLRNPNYPYTSASYEKLLVCPPTSAKNQLKSGSQARGIRDVTVDGETGAVATSVVWLDAFPHPVPVASSAVTTTSHPTNAAACPGTAAAVSTAGEGGRGLPLVNVVNNAPTAVGAAREPRESKAEVAKADWSPAFNLLATLAWPLILLVGLALFREEIRALFSRVPGSVDKISIMNFSVEFAKVRELAPRWGEDTNLRDLRRSASANNVSDSNLPAFFEQLRQTTPVDYAVVDLGEGREWLSSRLFILSLLLRRMRGLKALVFVERAAGSRRKFIGWADPDRVRWALARQYQWLEPAFASAYNTLIEQQANSIEFTSDEGRMENRFSPQASPALDLLRGFLAKIQRLSPAPPPPGIAPPEADWVAVDQAYQEHAHWVDAGLLEDILGDCLETAAVTGADLRGTPKTEQIKLILGQRGRFVAVTRDGGRFDYLIDRTALTERIAEGFPAA